MRAVTPILVHVVNSGTDWLSLTAVIATGVVGLAGIGATVWQARQGWAREEKRAKVAVKRRAYVEVLAALNDCVNASLESPEASDALNRAIKAAIIAIYAMFLVAPGDVFSLSHNVLNNAIDRADSETTGNAIGDLMVAMAKDLGERPPAGPAEPLIAKGPVEAESTVADTQADPKSEAGGAEVTPNP